MNLLDITIDVLKYINLYLQRVDQISLKISNKYLFENILVTMSLDTELLLYTKTIDKLDYAWKNDLRFIQIVNLNHRLSKKYSIFKKYALTRNLWYFDFNAQFDVVAGKYIIVFLTSVEKYKINLELTDKFGNNVKSTHSPKSNKIKVEFDFGGRLKVNCNETTNLKNYETIQYIMCIPEYYWKKLKGFEVRKSIIKIAEWKKQIKYGEDLNYLIVSHYI
jgi:hypothetical protein